MAFGRGPAHCLKINDINESSLNNKRLNFQPMVEVLPFFLDSLFVASKI